MSSRVSANGENDSEMSDSDSDEDEETESLLFHYMDDDERRVLFQLARLEPPTKLQAMAEAGSSAAQVSLTLWMC